MSSKPPLDMCELKKELDKFALCPACGHFHDRSSSTDETDDEASSDDTEKMES